MSWTKGSYEIILRFKEVKERAGCKILLAQKAFSMFSLYPLIAQYLDGTAASGLHEAMLGHKYFMKENHVFSAAYTQAEFDGVLPICSHVVFNSFSQWDKFKKKALEAGVSCGIRINPEHSTQKDAIYDPCSLGSRLGVTAKHFRFDGLDGIEGLHFHTLCEQNSDALVETLQVVEEKFSTCFNRLKWINMGGGHHITRDDYDINALIDCIENFRKKYPHLEVYLEPGEAIALNAGFLCASVLDVVNNDTDIAILDTSAACHMPDVLEMPYRPRVIGSGVRGEKSFSYTLAGPTCLAGDIIGEYSFDKPLAPDDILVFEDMAIYSMVKNNTFNGMNLPSIAINHEKTGIKVVKSFGYDEFEVRLS
jgi:carboxynorspermidine decarboxylase